MYHQLYTLSTVEMSSVVSSSCITWNLAWNVITNKHQARSTYLPTIGLNFSGQRALVLLQKKTGSLKNKRMKLQSEATFCS